MPAIPAIISVVGGIAAAKIASNQANKATQATSDANNRADQILEQQNDRAFGLQQDQQNYERWLQSATATARQPYLDAFSSLLGAGGGSGYAPQNYNAPAPYQAPVDPGAAKFVAPTQAEAENDPGYQFALSQGNQGIEHSASARGTLLTGGTAKDLALFNQNAASTQYDKVYQRAQGEAQLTEAEREQAFNTNSQNAFNAYSLNSQNAYNAANLNNQSAYNAASLGLQGYGQRLSALGTLASLASPGAYPGSTGYGVSNPSAPVSYPGLPSPGNGGYGGEPAPSLGKPLNSVDNLGQNQENPANLPYGPSGSGIGYTPSVLGRVSY